MQFMYGHKIYYQSIIYMKMHFITYRKPYCVIIDPRQNWIYFHGNEHCWILLFNMHETNSHQMIWFWSKLLIIYRQIFAPQNLLWSHKIHQICCIFDVSHHILLSSLNPVYFSTHLFIEHVVKLLEIWVNAICPILEHTRRTGWKQMNHNW